MSVHDASQNVVVPRPPPLPAGVMVVVVVVVVVGEQEAGSPPFCSALENATHWPQSVTLTGTMPGKLTTVEQTCVAEAEKSVWQPSRPRMIRSRGSEGRIVIAAVGAGPCDEEEEERLVRFVAGKRDGEDCGRRVVVVLVNEEGGEEEEADELKKSKGKDVLLLLLANNARAGQMVATGIWTTATGKSDSGIAVQV